MDDLTQKECTPCRAGALRMNKDEIKEKRKNIPGWDVLEQDGVFMLFRVFRFKNFQAALAFTNRVGDLAEEAGHHPSILTEWGRVSVTLWTHKIKGLHLNDFIMAAKIDQLA